MPFSKQKLKLWTLLTLGAVVLLLLAALHFSPFGQRLTDWNTLSGLFRNNSPQAQATFILISTLLIMFGIPRLLFFSLGGFAFGFWVGLFCSVCSILLGSFLSFRLARWVGRDWLSKHFGSNRHFGRIANAAPSVITIAMLRMLPISNAAINAALAVSRANTRTFLLGSLLGFLPHGVIAVMVGGGLAEETPLTGWIQIGIAFALSLAILIWQWKRHPNNATSASE